MDPNPYPNPRTKVKDYAEFELLENVKRAF